MKDHSLARCARGFSSLILAVVDSMATQDFRFACVCKPCNNLLRFGDGSRGGTAYGDSRSVQSSKSLPFPRFRADNQMCEPIPKAAWRLLFVEAEWGHSGRIWYKLR